MKRLVSILAAAAAVFLFCSAAVGAEEAPGVEKFLKEAKADGMVVAVMGVVCKVNPVEKRFGLSDSKKFGCCATPENCITGVLPVEWQGQLPKDGATVRARGKVVDSGGKLLFKADDVKVLEEPKK